VRGIRLLDISVKAKLTVGYLRGATFRLSYMNDIEYQYYFSSKMLVFHIITCYTKGEKVCVLRKNWLETRKLRASSAGSNLKVYYGMLTVLVNSL